MNSVRKKVISKGIEHDGMQNGMFLDMKVCKERFIPTILLFQMKVSTISAVALVHRCDALPLR